MIQESVAAALPGAISTALSASYSGKSLLKDPKVWHIDSATSNHMTGDSTQFSTLSNLSSQYDIVTANGSKLPASGIGSVSLFTNVLHVPSLKANLISVGQLVDQNCIVIFSPTGCIVQNLRTGRILARGIKVGRLFFLRLVANPTETCFLSIAATDIER